MDRDKLIYSIMKGYFKDIENLFNCFRKTYVKHCNNEINDIKAESKDFTDSLSVFKNNKDMYIEKIKKTLY